MSSIEELLAKYNISEERKRELMDKEALILPLHLPPKEKRISVTSMNCLKFLRINGISTDYLCQNSEEIELVDYGASEIELGILILNNALISIITGLISNYIYETFVKKEKRNWLKVSIYYKENDRIVKKEFEGNGKNVLKALQMELDGYEQYKER